MARPRAVFWHEWLKVVHDPRDRHIIEFFRDNPRYVSEMKLVEHQSLYRDRFGDLCYDRWERQIQDFTRTKLRRLPEPGENWMGSAAETVGSVLDRIWYEFQIELPASDEPSIDDAAEFERRCAAAFEASGYRVRVTGQSGDQGADVVAEKHGRRVAVQCKLHQAPIGNAAVQEVEAARRFHRCHQAMVVSTSGFTKAARTLAAALNVELLLFSELQDAISE